jgi:thiamine pyrophosphokinase
MRYVVITGGPNIQYDNLIEMSRPGDYILCADSGAYHARKMGLVPSRLTGDLDSIDIDTLTWIRDLHVPLDVYPVEKDMTDTELCLRSIPKTSEIILICSFSGRTDHVLSNYLLAGRLASEGYHMIMTDGITTVFPISGPYELRFSPENSSFWQKHTSDQPDNVMISLFPLFSDARGVTTTGLKYLLCNATLHPGSTFSVSNSPKKNAPDIIVRVDEGVLLVFITRDR